MLREAVLLSVLIGICSGCGARQEIIAPEVELPECPSPEAPSLPLLDSDEPLESPANIEKLMLRDDVMRAYIDGLRAAIACREKRHE